MKRKQKAQRKLWIILMAVVLAIAVSFGIFLVAQRVSYPLKYQDQIEQMARKYDLEPSLIFGVKMCIRDRVLYSSYGNDLQKVSSICFILILLFC